MRSRSKGTLDAITAVGSGCYYVEKRKAGTWPNYYIETRTTPRTPYANLQIDTRETMTDELGRSKYNYCSHAKPYPYHLQCNFADKVYNPTLDQLITSWQTSESHQGSLETIISFQGLKIGGPGPLSASGLPSPDWAELVSQVGSQLDGHMQTGQNLLVSIAEISQTIGMFKNPGNVRKLRKLAAKGKLTLRELSKSPANAWLEWEFGWKNLFRDMDALASVWREVRLHQAHLESAANRFQSLAARQTTEISNPSLSLSSVPYTGTAPGYVNIVPKIEKIQGIHTFSLDLWRTPEMAAWSKFDQVCSRLGMRSVAEALWDLVPFSFVVDWFTHINRDIRRGSVNWNSFKTRYVGYSTKIEWYGYFDIVSRATTTWGRDTVSLRTGSQIVQKSYGRVAGFPPDTSSVGVFGSLSKTQLADGVALIIQRM